MTTQRSALENSSSSSRATRSKKRHSSERENDSSKNLEVNLKVNAKNVEHSNRNSVSNAIQDVLKKLQNSNKDITIKKTSQLTEINVPQTTQITANVDELIEEKLDESIEILEEDSPTDPPNTVESELNTDQIPSPKKKSIAPKTIIVNVEAPPIYLCMMCNTKFPSFVALKGHMKNNRRCSDVQFKCAECNKLFNNRKGLRQHIQTHKQKPTFVCEQCGKTFTHRSNLENHRSAQHGEYVEEEFDSIYRCKECNSQFTNRRDLYEHIKGHTKIVTPVLCDHCGRSFKSAESLRSHMRGHQNIRPFACTFCQRCFRSRLQLNQHLHVHTGIKSFKCKHCNREFAKRDSLVVHTRTHTGETPYPCEHCTMKFSTISKRKTHCRIRHPEQAKDSIEKPQDGHQADVVAIEQLDDMIEPVSATHLSISDDVIVPLSSTETSYVTYSTAFIDSDNILVFESPDDITMDDVPSLAVIE